AADRARSRDLPAPGSREAAASSAARSHEIRARSGRRHARTSSAGLPAIVPSGSIRIELNINLSEAEPVRAGPHKERRARKWGEVKECAAKAGIVRLSPHDCRRYAERRVMPNPIP